MDIDGTFYVFQFVEQEQHTATVYTTIYPENPFRYQEGVYLSNGIYGENIYTISNDKFTGQVRVFELGVEVLLNCELIMLGAKGAVFYTKTNPTCFFKKLGVAIEDNPIQTAVIRGAPLDDPSFRIHFSTKSETYWKDGFKDEYHSNPTIPVADIDADIYNWYGNVEDLLTGVHFLLARITLAFTATQQISINHLHKVMTNFSDPKQWFYCTEDII